MFTVNANDLSIIAYEVAIMENTNDIPVASPRKSIEIVAKSEVFVPEINIENVDDVVAQVVNEPEDEPKVNGANDEVTDDVTDNPNDYNSIFKVREVVVETVNEEAVESAKEVLDEDVQIDDQEIQVDNAEEEVVTISDALAKAHFPEMLEKPQEIYEVTNQEGKVVEQWYEIKDDQAASNLEVLNKLEQEAETEEDKADIKKLLAWASKKSKSKKTTTMIVREKKREDRLKKAVDVEAKEIVIEELNSDYGPPKTAAAEPQSTSASSSRFQVKKANVNSFQVRKKSVIQPVSETVVTRSWLENAIRVFEDEQSVVLVSMKFDRDKEGAYQANIQAEVGPDKIIKVSRWTFVKYV